MSLIIKDKIKQLMRGYPTVSDKYNVQGGINEGATSLKFGDSLMYGSQTGYYKKAASLSSVEDFAGFVLATNVKLEDTWSGSNDGPLTLTGEAFNVFMNGFIAVQLDSGATPASITEGASVSIILASGNITTSDKNAASTIVTLPDYQFTGVYETQADDTIIAEIRKIC